MNMKIMDLEPPAGLTPGALTTGQQLAAARVLTQRFGALVEAQVLNLKLWPFVVDPALSREGGSECVVDLKVESGLYAVTYQWRRTDIKPGWRPDAAYAGRLKRLKEAVATALGPQFVLRVFMNGDLVWPGQYDTGAKRGKSGKKRGAGPKRAGAGPKRRRK